MSDLTERTVAALRAHHDLLASRVADLDDDQLGATSGATEWSVAQVLSHLGSGAEIGLATLQAALGGNEPPGQDFNQGVWARWDARAPRDQAASFAEHSSRLVDAITGVDDPALAVRLGFLPQPLPFESYTGMRLNEVALHTWDVLVGLDGRAEIDGAAAGIVLEHLATGLSFLAGFLGKPEGVSERVVLDLAATGFVVVVDDGVSVTADGEPTATLSGPDGAALRLIGGRLRAEHSAGVTVSGNATLDQLRVVFPGY